jgi:AraC-like DNA-binding protein
LRFVSWSQAERRIAGEEASDFFDRPLAEPWLFHFTTSRLKVDPHAGAFSLKVVLSGEECYAFGKRAVRLRPGQLLFTAADRVYASEVAIPTESLSIFLPDAAASAFWTESRREHDDLIDVASADIPAAVPSVSWQAGAAAMRQLARLRQALAKPGEDGESAMLGLLFEAGSSWRRGAPLRDLTGPRRAATREELQQRVMRARDLIFDLGGVGCRLDLLAEEACLSRFHFLRVFSEAFGRTPGDFARTVRLARAAAALRSGEAAPEAARAAGYSRAGALRRAQAASAAC